MERKKHLEKAATELATLLEKHFDALSPHEREAKSAAFRQAVAKIGSRAKSSEPLKTQGIRRPTRRHA
jgi:hypothetical protein